MRPHTAGETCQGRGVPGGGQGTRQRPGKQCSGAAEAPGTAIAPASVGRQSLSPAA